MLPLVESVPGSSGDPKPKYNYLLLFVCALSKYPVAFSITSKESIVVAKALWNVICTFGVAQTITSDNGLEFCNQVVDTLVNMHGFSGVWGGGYYFTDYQLSFRITVRGDCLEISS